MLKREQFLEIDDKDQYRLINTINDDLLIKELREERREIGKGFTQEKTMRKVASIPTEVLVKDFDGWLFYNAPIGSPEGKVALRRFLQKHPEYQCSDGTI